MNPDIIPIRVQVSENSFIEGTFTLYEEAPSDSNKVLLSISFSDRQESAIAEDFFEALAQLRTKLEPENIWLICNGAAKNIWPSSMARSMGYGLKAYKLALGVPAKTEDLVSIFENTLDLPPAPVQTQTAFYKEWIESLKRG